MPPSIPARIPPAALILAFVVAACGDDGAPADTSCPETAGPCECDATRPECVGSSGSSGAGGSGEPTSAAPSEDGDASSGSGGGAAAFSVLPPLDVLGAEWVYENENFQAEVVVEERCSIAELYEWPDGVPGATWRCLQNGTLLQDKEYALLPDRVVAREIGMFAYDPPLEIFRVPVDVGDAWETAWKSPSVTEGVSSWVVVDAERIDLPFGSFDAAKVELTSTSSAGTGITMMWWVDGIGTVRALSDEFRYELVEFSPP